VSTKAGQVQNFSELERELRRAETDGREQMRGLARAKRIDSWLAADARPGSMQGAVKPETGLVFELDYASAGSRFFFDRRKRLFQPQRLALGVGFGQPLPGALHRKSKLVHAESGACRSPIPAQADHLFRSKPITDSEASRSLIEMDPRNWTGL